MDLSRILGLIVVLQKKLVKYFLTEVILVAYAGLLNEVVHGSCFHGRSPSSRFEGTRFLVSLIIITISFSSLV